ncbi:MAG: amidohydrolase family protein [Promethearchaeota archaeon]
MFIDIHVHTRRLPGFPRNWLGDTWASPEMIVEKYKKYNIEKGVILPIISPECLRVPQSIEDVLEICEKWQDKFIPFCNLDPRMLINSTDAPFSEYLWFYQDRGCRGVGEIMANLRFDDPLVENMLWHVQQAEMPMIFHVATKIGGTYGLYDDPGLPLLEKALKKFPKLIFIGHSQAFWSEIAEMNDENLKLRGGYPKGPIEKPGRVVDLMRRYPNLLGDLSAHSGYNALSRDDEFAIKFLTEFQDKLYFGTDVCSPRDEVPLAGYLEKLKEDGQIADKVFWKIARENAIKLLNL